MADKRVLADTSILIDFFRKTDKSNSALFSLVKNDYTFCIGSITEYEIYTGATGAQMQYWQEFLQTIVVLPFDHNAVVAAVAINNILKRKRNRLAWQTSLLQQRL